MKVIQLPDVLHEYLVHVIEKHAASGIHPEEGMAVAKLWEATVKNATHIDDAAIAKAAAAGTPAGQSRIAGAEPDGEVVVTDYPKEGGY